MKPQPKVSMVIPCYNKEKYIARMFDSILAQDWDNIELVLVNDGSTDNTRETIAYYESVFISRGFEVVIIDQENQGVAGAVYTGLTHISGEYVCQVDADDVLDAGYLSEMAGWLAAHEEYDWATCDIRFIFDDRQYDESAFPHKIGQDKFVEQFLLWKIQPAIWRLMIRASYFEKCKVMDHFYKGREGAQEAQVFLPLIINKGRIKHIPKALYHVSYNNLEEHLSHSKDYTEACKWYDAWYNPVYYTIDHLCASETEKQRYRHIAELSRIERLFKRAQIDGDESDVIIRAREYVDCVNRVFSLERKVKYCTAPEIQWLVYAVNDFFLGLKPKNLQAAPVGRVIAWGALGGVGRRWLPDLEDTILSPNELWDAAGDGSDVIPPDAARLKEDDLVLVLPVVRKVRADIVRQIKHVGCKYLLFPKLYKRLPWLMNTQFYDGTAELLPRLSAAEDDQFFQYEDDSAEAKEASI